MNDTPANDVDAVSDMHRPPDFESINAGYNKTFKPDSLSLGLVIPIENYAQSAVPTMVDHIERVQLAEELGFSAVWMRDVPFNDPTFGDAGQIYDPFVYLGFLAAHTERIALGVASIILPLRHPAHVAKAAASTDVLSGGRLILGIASGDRPQEYPALNVEFENRGQRFRDSLSYIRQMAETAPRFDNPWGNVQGGLDLLPKPSDGRIPLLITGGSQQSPDWIAEHGDGWMTYPRNAEQQAAIINDYQTRVEKAGRSAKPVTQSLYIDLLGEADAPPQPIHLGFRSGIHALRQYLESLRDIGVNHVAINLRLNRAPIRETTERLAKELFPEFS